jgi:hypothetical protein
MEFIKRNQAGFGRAIGRLSGLAGESRKKQKVSHLGIKKEAESVTSRLVINY